MVAGDSWFSYGAGQSTATFTDRAFPSNVVTIADFPAEDIEEAHAVCRGNGVEDGPQFEDCVFDMLVTGDVTYAQAAAAITGEVFDPLAKSFDALGSLSESFTTPVPTNFAYPRYLDDPATSRVAGPVFDSTGYGFYLLDAPRHDGLSVTLRLVAYGDLSADSLAQSVGLRVDDRAPISVPLEGTAPAYTGPGSLNYVRSGQTQGGTQFSMYDLQVPLDHFGRALRVRLEPHNFRGIIGTSLGVNSIQLGTTTVPEQVFDTSLPFEFLADQPVTGAGRLESGGSEDDYRFGVPAAGGDLFLSHGPGVELELVRQGEGPVAASESSSSHVRYDGLPGGAYTVRVTGTGGPVTYRLAGNMVAPDVAVPYSLDDPAVQVATTTPGQDATVTFAGVEGQRIQLETSGAVYSAGGMEWNVRLPDGSRMRAWHSRVSRERPGRHLRASPDG